MTPHIHLQSHTGPVRLSIAASEPVTARILTGPVGIRLLGQPGPQGATGPEGEKGAPGDPGVTLLPTDTPINGGFF